MWTSVYMSQNLDIAREMRQKIEAFKIPVMLRSINVENHAGEDCFELLVPSSELGEALNIIISE